ncbi:hypothetical protein ABQF45_12950 [Mycolicibacterium sp. XJ766]|nr:hypothetical protein [Mycolicibacterium peregrinum]
MPSWIPLRLLENRTVPLRYEAKNDGSGPPVDRVSSSGAFSLPKPANSAVDSLCGGGTAPEIR